MGQYKDITVTFTLDEYQQQQLNNIYLAFKNKGFEFDSAESLFRSIMTIGSTYDVAKKLAYNEWQAGISEYKSSDEIYQETKERIEKRNQAKEHPIDTATEERIDAAIDEVMEQEQLQTLNQDMEPEL